MRALSLFICLVLGAGPMILGSLLHIGALIIAGFVITLIGAPIQLIRR